MTQLIVKQSGQDDIVQVTKDVFSIGRISPNDLVIAAEGISRNHCEIIKTGDIYTIKDLKSLNGTYVNGFRVIEQQLSPGDRIKLGETVIIFEEENIPYKDIEEKQISQNNDFIFYARKSHFNTLVFVLVIIVVIGGIVLWQLSLSTTTTKSTVTNLLEETSSFENSEESVGQLPKRWTVTPKSGAPVLITQNEKHTGNRALLIDKVNIQDLYTTCSYDKIIVSSITTAVTFGGYIKSDAFNKSAAGFCISWFREGEKKPFLESFTDLVVPHDRWQEISITVPVPLCLLNERFQNYVIQFTCIKVGGSNAIYFDDVSVILSSQLPIENHLVTQETKDLKLTGYYNGTWSLLRKNNEPILQNGNLAVKSVIGEGTQNLSMQAIKKSTGFRQMFLSDPNEWMDYEVNFAGGADSLKIVYSIPFQKLFLKTNSIYFKYTIPINVIEKSFKMRGAELKEIPTHEKTEETKVSQLELTLGENILVIKYSKPLDVFIKPDGNELEIKQGIFSKDDLANYQNETVLLETTFYITPVVKETAETLQGLLENGKELEADEKLGEAIVIYRRVTENAEKNSQLLSKAQESLKILSEKAKKDLEVIKTLADEAVLTGENNIFDQTEEICTKLMNVYKNTEYAQETESILKKIREARKMIKESSVKNELENLMTFSKGYFKEKKWDLAKVFALRIIALGPESPEAKKAKEILDDIKVKENTENSQH